MKFPFQILLRTDKRQNAGANYSDRQLLKNLGMWLGAITIARGRPILLKELDLKSLLLEAYYKGQSELLFVVPFISKILLSCSKTPVSHFSHKLREIDQSKTFTFQNF